MKKSSTSDYTIAYLTMASGLSISAVAIYYSVIGLISIFAAAAIPIMIMGIVLELSKLIATVWLKRHWEDGPFLLKSGFFIIVLVFMFITSMGIFGFLSKAHSDQAVPTGDIADKVALLDDKIKTQKENIEAARKALTQLDSAVDQTMSRSSSELGASRSVQIRKSQSKERNQLQQDIAQAQLEILKLREERAPVANDLRRVEAEVGPIKYIAALIYGDALDSNILERAVRWMIILIVSVFDPMAVMLLLAAQHSFKELQTPILEQTLTTEEPISNYKSTQVLVDIDTSNEEDALIEIPPTDEYINTSGNNFPEDPIKGQPFKRTDFNPPRDFMFNGIQWVDTKS